MKKVAKNKMQTVLLLFIVFIVFICYKYLYFYVFREGFFASKKKPKDEAGDEPPPLSLIQNIQ